MVDSDVGDAQKFLASLMPLYARETTIVALQSQGFEIESQNESNEIVRIIAGKWV